MSTFEKAAWDPELILQEILTTKISTVLGIEPLILRLISPKFPATLCRSWFRLCATSQKVVSSISGGVNGIFLSRIPSGRTISLGSTQLLAEMSIRNLFRVKGSQCIGLVTLPTLCAETLESRSLNFLVPSGPVQSCTRIDLPSLFPEFQERILISLM